MIVLIVGGTLLWNDSRRRQDRPLPVHQVFDPDLHSIAAPETAPKGSPALNRALAEATSATLDLARTASEPAGRISRDMLDAAEEKGVSASQRPSGASETGSAGPEEELVGLSMTLPSLDPLRSETSGASRVLQQVGDHLSAGAAPLSSTARHAFGFLLGPARVRAGSPAARSSSTGA
jgi:hypothetical protein